MPAMQTAISSEIRFILNGGFSTLDLIGLP
jgi:hypothetical protein